MLEGKKPSFAVLWRQTPGLGGLLVWLGGTFLVFWQYICTFSYLIHSINTHTMNFGVKTVPHRRFQDKSLYLPRVQRVLSLAHLPHFNKLQPMPSTMNYICCFLPHVYNIQANAHTPGSKVVDFPPIWSYTLCPVLICSQFLKALFFILFFFFLFLISYCFSCLMFTLLKCTDILREYFRNQ